ncbi:MAG: hypothetical protein ACR5LA_10250 [Wolbachia sp.]
MYNAEIKSLERLKEIISEFTKRSDAYNQMCQDKQHSAPHDAEIDLIKLEEITRKFVNDLGNISEEEVLKHKKCKITLPGEKQLVENLRKLEEKVSNFIKFVNAGQYENDGQHAAFFLCHGGKDLMVLAKIAGELFHEQDTCEFVEEEEFSEEVNKESPNTSLEIKDTQEVGRLSQAYQYLSSLFN